MVLPPSKLPSGTATTISIPPYPTTIDAPGGGVITVTITVTAITTTEIPMGNVNVTIGQPANATFYPSPSIDLPPAAVSFTGGDGRVTTTSLIIPPWPSIGMGPPDTWPSITGPWGPVGNFSMPTGTPSGSVPTESPDRGLWPDEEPVVVACPPSTFEIEAYSATITLKDCKGTTTLDWLCPPTTTMAMGADASVSIALGCTMFTGTIQPTTTTATPIPPFVDFLAIPTPPTQKQQEDDNDDGSHYLPCDSWFFSVSYLPYLLTQFDAADVTLLTTRRPTDLHRLARVSRFRVVDQVEAGSVFRGPSCDPVASGHHVQGEAAHVADYHGPDQRPYSDAREAFQVRDGNSRDLSDDDFVWESGQRCGYKDHGDEHGRAVRNHTRMQGRGRVHGDNHGECLHRISTVAESSPTGRHTSQFRYRL